MFNDITFDLGKKILDATSLRQQTISHNIANINTKDYKSKQVVFESELQKMMGNGTTLAATDARHYGTSGNYESFEAKIVESNSSTMMNLDGNNVDIDLEMANMAANQIQYNTLIRQVSDRLNNYHYVIRGN